MIKLEQERTCLTLKVDNQGLLRIKISENFQEDAEVRLNLEEVTSILSELTNYVESKTPKNQDTEGSKKKTLPKSA